LSDLRKTAADANADAPERNRAIAVLSQGNSPGVSELLQQLLEDPAVRVAALRGLASERNATTPKSILTQYSSFDAAARQEAISALASRREYAIALLDAMEQGVVPRDDMTAFHAQQLQSLQDAGVDKRLAKLWGAVRVMPDDRTALVAQQKARLTPDELASADLSHGRAVFEKTCATCHRLFNSGGTIGPDLTGSQRANLDYVLSNVLDPSAIVAKDYQLTVFQMADGRVLTGIIVQENQHSVTVQTANERVVIPRDEIEASNPSEVSMMPDRLLDPLSDADIRDLVGYLASAQQVPLPNK
jgi:putative heme-binding domain-containing protein